MLALMGGHIDLSIGTWRGLGVAKATPPEIVSVLKLLTQQTANEPALREVMDKQNMGYAYADDATFKAGMAKDNACFKVLMAKLNIKS